MELAYVTILGLYHQPMKLDIAGHIKPVLPSIVFAWIKFFPLVSVIEIDLKMLVLALPLSAFYVLLSS